MSGSDEEKDDFPWSLGVFDAHCHPTDTMSTVPDISKMNARSLAVMATRAQDQDLVDQVAAEQRLEGADPAIDDSKWRGVVPSFGWHPWFSYQIFDDIEYEYHLDQAGNLTPEAKKQHYQSALDPASADDDFLARLPEPRSLNSFIGSTSDRLLKYPTALIGEVGLDKAFRIPEAWLPDEVHDRDDSLTPGGREGRRLSPYRVSLDHQKKVLFAQLRLAGSLQRAVSVHGVQAHGHLYDTLQQTWAGHERSKPTKRQRKQAKSKLDGEAPSEGAQGQQAGETSQLGYPPRVCLHSYSGPPDTLKRYFDASVPVEFFVSFSIVINFSTAAASKTEQCIKAAPDDRILIESDMHIAGKQMDENLKQIATKVCELKGWDLNEGVTQLADNWKAFVFGDACTRHTSGNANNG